MRHDRGYNLSRQLGGILLVTVSLAVAPAEAGDASVEAAQRALKAIGYDVGQPDGMVGRRTREALKAFQAAAGLPVTGEVDPQTAARLTNAKPTSAATPVEIQRAATPAGQRVGTVAPNPAPTPALVPQGTVTPAPSSVPANLQRTSSGSSGSGLVWLIAVVAVIWFIARRRKRATGQRSTPTGTIALPKTLRGTQFASSREIGARAVAAGYDQRRAAPVRWVESGECVTIAGHRIDGGLLYLGTLGVTQWGEDNAIIDPELPVARTNPDTAGATVPYYPRYSQITPQARLAFLTWLASGKEDPAANIGYVFLYFYGLERRLMVDRSSGDASLITAELQRLLSIYGENGSFARYCSELLEAARLLGGRDAFEDHPPEAQSRSWELPVALRVALGRRLVAGKPLTAEWMFAWLIADPETRLRTPAHRAATEFRALFTARFAANYPAGISVKPPKARFKPVYRMASGHQQIQLAIGDVPDIAAIKGPLNQARAIAESCVDALDPYSRFLGRNSVKAGTLEAALLLPPELRGVVANEPLQRVSAWLEQRVASQLTILPGKELLERLELNAQAKLARRDAIRLPEILRGFGIGIEPDANFGTGVVVADEPVCLFRLPADAVALPSDAYGGMSLMINLGLAVAQSDGIVDPDEERALSARIDAATQLPQSERIRLQAHLRRIKDRPADQSALKSRLAALTASERHSIAELGIALAALDGRVDTAEIKTLERLYALLGFDKARVFSDLHAGAASDELASFKDSGSLAQGRRIPPSPSPVVRVAPELDPERLKRILADTKRVSTVLGAVFQEDVSADSDQATPSDLEPEEVGEDADVLAGLDRQHRALVDVLLTRAEWPADDYARLARSMDVLPDGALETVNAWAFDRFDEALVEDGNPLVVNRHLIEKRTLEAA